MNTTSGPPPTPPSDSDPWDSLSRLGAGLQPQMQPSTVPTSGGGPAPSSPPSGRDAGGYYFMKPVSAGVEPAQPAQRGATPAGELPNAPALPTAKGPASHSGGMIPSSGKPPAHVPEADAPSAVFPAGGGASGGEAIPGASMLSGAERPTQQPTAGMERSPRVPSMANLPQPPAPMEPRADEAPEGGLIDPRLIASMANEMFRSMSGMGAMGPMPAPPSLTSIPGSSQAPLPEADPEGVLSPTELAAPRTPGSGSGFYFEDPGRSVPGGSNVELPLDPSRAGQVQPRTQGPGGEMASMPPPVAAGNDDPRQVGRSDVPETPHADPSSMSGGEGTDRFETASDPAAVNSLAGNALSRVPGSDSMGVMPMRGKPEPPAIDASGFEPVFDAAERTKPHPAGAGTQYYFERLGAAREGSTPDVPMSDQDPSMVPGQPDQMAETSPAAAQITKQLLSAPPASGYTGKREPRSSPEDLGLATNLTNEALMKVPGSQSLSGLPMSSELTSLPLQSPISRFRPEEFSSPEKITVPPAGQYEAFYFLPDASPMRAPSAPGDTFDVNAVREDFPILHQTVHGKPLIWLDNAATTQKPRQVINALSEFYERHNSNIHRGAHTLAARATDLYETAREKVQRFLGAGSSSEIIFVRGTTEGVNFVAQTFGRRFIAEGDEILLTQVEHHANIVPWQLLASETGAKIRVAPVDDRGEIILEEYVRLLTPKTRLVGITHVSNALGTVLPVKTMIDAAHRFGAQVIVDGAQAVSHLKVDVREIGADFYVFSGHKLFGPTGVGAVYARRELLELMPPWQGGGNMIESVSFDKTTYAGVPFKFEAGTGILAGAVGLGAAIDYLGSLGLERAAQYEHELLCYATEKLADIPGVRIIGTARDKVSVLSFVIRGMKSEDVGPILDNEGIAVRSGHHCAQPTMQRFGVTGTVRPSIAFYNTRHEIDVLEDAVRRIASDASAK